MRQFRIPFLKNPLNLSVKYSVLGKKPKCFKTKTNQPNQKQKKKIPHPNALEQPRTQNAVELKAPQI